MSDGRKKQLRLERKVQVDAKPARPQVPEIPVPPSPQYTLTYFQ